MSLPFFYQPDLSSSQIILDEDTSRHIVQVLRMKVGEQLNLTDGKGILATCSIVDDHKKHCVVKIQDTRHKAQGTRRVSIGISLLKNASRFEWFLEKATEIGIDEIIPLLCERTEKEKFRFDRLRGIVISAMLQSQQVWLPALHEPVAYHSIFQNKEIQDTSQKLIAHCIEGEAKQSISHPSKADPNSTSPHSFILIGPEGDFTPAEIELALQHQFIPVSLGETRLRTETAGIVAATLLR